MTKNKPIEFTFVYADSPREAKGWWLKIKSIEELLAYTERTSGQKITPGFELYWDLTKRIADEHYQGSVMDYINNMCTQERFALMMQDMNAWNIMYAAVKEAQNTPHANIMDGFRFLNMGLGQAYLNHIRKDGFVFINKSGGCNSIIEYKNWCRKKELVWPDFKASDIRLKQFEGGQHWYAYIGSMEVHNGDTLRFNSKSDAYTTALAIINKA